MLEFFYLTERMIFVDAISKMCFVKQMPLNVFGNSSFSSAKGNIIGASLFAQSTYLRTNCVESTMEEVIHIRNQYGFKNLACPMENTDAACKFYVDSGLRDPNIIKNTAQVDFNHKNLDTVRFVKVNNLPGVFQHLSPKQFVDDTVDKITLVRTYRISDFDSIDLSNISHTILYFDPTD